MAYSGERMLVDDLLFKPAHSLIDQSLHARGGAETTSGAAGRWTSQRMHTGLEASTTLTPDRLSRGETGSHTEVRAMNRRHRFGRSADLHSGSSLPPEQK